MNKSVTSHLKICLINIYFGKWPAWVPYFLKTCAFNSEIDFYFFSDNSDILIHSDNIKFYKFSINDFNILASNKLGFKTSLKRPYKICDFKPIFGKIFEDYIKDYDFWGYCDNDLILGDIKKFLTDEILTNYDIISTYNEMMSGPFCIYKNCEQAVNLFRNIPDYINILMDDKNYAFDEIISKDNLKKISLQKIRYAFIFLVSEMLKSNFSLKKTKELRNQFRRYYRNKEFKNRVPTDMTEAVWQARNNKHLKIFFKELLFSDSYFHRININNYRIIWYKGKLFDTRLNEELFAFHFKLLKSNKDFAINDFNNENLFIINNNAIY